MQDDIMLSVLVRALPKAIQQHVPLQMTETATYAQVRSMVVGYESTLETSAQSHDRSLCLLLIRVLHLWTLADLRKARRGSPKAKLKVKSLQRARIKVRMTKVKERVVRMSLKDMLLPKMISVCTV